MKKILLPLLGILLLVACEKEQPVVEKDANLITTVDFRNDAAAIAMIETLIAEVEQLLAAGQIGNGPAQSILSKLRSIKKKLEQGKTEEALGKLADLATHLEELAAEGTVDAGIVADLLSGVEEASCETAPFDGDGDGSPCNLDCDDSDPNVNPGAAEILCNGVDDDCDAGTPDSIVEIPYNGIDDDCDPATPDDDLDGDGYNLGEDCDDNNGDVYPGAEEICGDGVDNNCDEQIDEGCLQIGDLHAGGIIIYLAYPPSDLNGDEIPDQGLVTTLTDLGARVPWGSAAGVARAHGGGGYNDWFLPSKDELNLIYGNKAAIIEKGGVFAFTAYWSSSEFNSYEAWIQSWYFGLQSHVSKNLTGGVRAVRVF